VCCDQPGEPSTDDDDIDRLGGLSVLVRGDHVSPIAVIIAWLAVVDVASPHGGPAMSDSVTVPAVQSGEWYPLPDSV
jgi:hypothetical protein